jgi:TolB-like protein/Tfp pilus assembly protein PilF
LSFFAELKRRNVLRIGATYLVAAWFLIQVAGTIFPLFGFSATPVRFVVILVVIGFIPVIVFAWVFELTPEGLKKDADVDRSKSIAPNTGKKLDRVIMVVLALALGYFAFDKFILDPTRDATLVEEMAKQARSDSSVESHANRSIAVLPFADMSPEGDQEYFSDGMAEELLNLLAKIPELKVTSRTSAFSYKGKDFKIGDVGRELNVSHVLEGSVRKAGNQVRVTAQLIKVDGDVHLWSETFDHSLDNIFAIQDEIASKVVEELKIKLLGEVPVASKTDPTAYALYLQGRHLRQQGTVDSIEQALAMLQQALEIDPGYVAVWNELTAVYINQTDLALRPAEDGLRLAREALNKALAIDPESIQAYLHQAHIDIVYNNDFGAAARHLTYAFRLGPANTNVFRSAAGLYVRLGRLEEAITLYELLMTLDPASAVTHSNLGYLYELMGRWDESIKHLRRALVLSPGYFGGHFKIGLSLLAKGEPQAALEAMQAEKTIFGIIGLSIVYHALGRTDESDAALATAIEKYEKGAPYNIAYILACRDEVDRAFEWLEKAVLYKDSGMSEIQIEPMFSNLHDDPRWIPFLENLGKSPEQLAAIRFEITPPE